MERGLSGGGGGATGRSGIGGADGDFRGLSPLSVGRFADAGCRAGAGGFSNSAQQPLRIPDQVDHRFRRKPITDSGGSRSLIPEQADH
jgi:hypothetical protein